MSNLASVRPMRVSENVPGCQRLLSSKISPCCGSSSQALSKGLFSDSGCVMKTGALAKKRKDETSCYTR